MNKSQQMRWSRRGADLLLHVRCAVYNGAPGAGFGRRFDRISNANPTLAEIGMIPQISGRSRFKEGNSIWKSLPEPASSRRSHAAFPMLAGKSKGAIRIVSLNRVNSLSFKKHLALATM